MKNKITMTVYKQALAVLEDLYLFSTQDEVKDIQELLDSKTNSKLIRHLKGAIK